MRVGYLAKTVEVGRRSILVAATMNSRQQVPEFRATQGPVLGDRQRLPRRRRDKKLWLVGGGDGLELGG